MQNLSMLEMINTAAVVGTFVVLAIAGISAAIQIRHLRASNQLQILHNMYARIHDPAMHESLEFVYFELPKRIVEDPTYLDGIATGQTRIQQSPLLVALWNDEIGYAMRHGLLSEDGVFELGAAPPPSSAVGRRWNRWSMPCAGGRRRRMRTSSISPAGHGAG
jgi:hypothetical protein